MAQHTCVGYGNPDDCEACHPSEDRPDTDAPSDEADRRFEAWHSRCCEDCHRRCEHKEWERVAYRRGREDGFAAGVERERGKGEPTWHQQFKMIQELGDAIAKLEAENAALTKRVEEAERDRDEFEGQGEVLIDKLAAAKAERDRAREALRKIADFMPCGDVAGVMQAFARRALAEGEEK